MYMKPSLLVHRGARQLSTTLRNGITSSAVRKSRIEDQPRLSTVAREKPRDSKKWDTGKATLSRASNVSMRRELVKKNPQIMLKAVKDGLNQIKSRLKTKAFVGDGTLRQCSILDPDMERFPAYTRRVYAAFDAESSLRGARPLENHVIEGCQAGYATSQLAQMKTALVDGYVHHIMVDLGYGDNMEHERMFESMHYPTELFPGARQIQRQIHLHVGPTNSGKTYNALKALEKAESGFYAGPLRLLAHEVYSRFVAQGVSCGLVTGDEVKGMTESPKLTSHTVEMAPLGKVVDVGVIDEIQMLGNKERGWAWTKALLGARAKELHLCGEERVVPLVRELAASMGDTLHIHQYQRLNPLKAMSRSLRGDLKNLRKGDCVVCFSILNLHAMKKDIEQATGRSCAIVYGSLPPEIRAQQARLFNDPDNTYDYLVASDAIGMGLNLSIKRIIFQSVYKFNGSKIELVDVPHLKQIAGRAGRYRSSHADTGKPIEGQTPIEPTKSSNQSIGLVTSMQEEDLAYVQGAMQQVPEPLKAAGLKPQGEVVAQFAAHFPLATPYTYIMNRMYELMSKNTHARYFLCDKKDTQSIARALEGIEGLSTQDKYTFTASPASVKEGILKEIVHELARCIGQQKKGHLLDLVAMPLEILEQPIEGNKRELEDLEVLHKGLTLYIWLSFRFGDIFESRVLAEHTKSLVEQSMAQILLRLSMDPNIREEMHRRHSKNRERLLKGTNVLLKNIAETQEASDASIVVPGQKWESSHVPAETIVDGSATDQPTANAHL